MFDTHYFSSIIIVISLFNIMGETNNEYTKLTAEEKQIALQSKTDIFNPQVWLQMKGMAEVFVQSKAFPSYNSAQIVTVMQSGREMGMAPIQSLNSLYIINGQINFWGKNLVRRIREFGWKIDYKDETDKSVTAVVTNTKDADEVYEETYTFDEADKSGYTKHNGAIKAGWREGINRKKKLRYGALQLIVHTYIPEVLGTAAGIVEVNEDVEYQNVTEVKTEVTEAKTEKAEKEDLQEFLKKSKETETKKVEKKAKEKVEKEKAVEAEVVTEQPKKEVRMVTPKQLKKLATLCTVKGVDRETLKKDSGVSSAKELTLSQARELIDNLEILPDITPEEKEELKHTAKPAKYTEAVEVFNKTCEDLGLDIPEEMVKAAKEMGRNSFDELSDVQIRLYTRGLNS